MEIVFVLSVALIFGGLLLLSRGNRNRPHHRETGNWQEDESRDTGNGIINAFAAMFVVVGIVGVVKAPAPPWALQAAMVLLGVLGLLWMAQKIRQPMDESLDAHGDTIISIFVVTIASIGLIIGGTIWLFYVVNVPS